MLRRIGIIAVLSLIIAAITAVPALAQSGHFVTGGGNAPTVTLNQTTNQNSPNLANLLISGKVAGLGGETFQIKVSGLADVTYGCRTGGGEFPNAANKQNIRTNVSAQTPVLNTPRNGQYNFSLTLTEPPSTLTCPPGQTLVLVSVSYTNLTLTLLEDGQVSDTATVPGTFSKTYFPNFP